MENIAVTRGEYLPVFKREIEVVERKGLGHPDSIIDGIVEEVSRNLCRTYLEEFGLILHHNVDKGLVIGGKAVVEFGGGFLEEPIDIIVTGRATFEADGKKFAVEEIGKETVREYLKKIRHLNVDRDTNISIRIRPGSKDLVELFLRNKGRIPLANDTSFGVGFAPFTETEKIALNVEKELNSQRFKQRYPYLGEDIKVMCLRRGNKIRVTVAAAFISAYFETLDEYLLAKEKIKKEIERIASRETEMEIEVFLNTADDENSGSVYITVTGTSAEAGDDGQVGRGNRVNGLITPFRIMTLEAAAGKNPVNHVGKIYQLVSQEIASEIYEEGKGEIEDVRVLLLSQIGKPINQPQIASVEVIGALEKYSARVKDIVRAKLENITEVTYKVVEGKYSVF